MPTKKVLSDYLIDGSVLAKILKSNISTGTSPLEVVSTTLVANLNADLLDGYHASAFAQASSLSNYLPLTGGTLSGELNFSDDGEGITLNGGARIYKKSGTGLVIRQPGGGQRLQEENNAGTILGTYAYTSEIPTNLNQLATRNFSDLQSKPTTLAGYGITDAAPISGSANYIQNQTTSAQSANMWISGNGRFGNNITLNDYANISSPDSGNLDFNKNTGGLPVFRWYGGGPDIKFNITALGAATFASTVTATKVTAQSDNGGLIAKNTANYGWQMMTGWAGYFQNYLLFANQADGKGMKLTPNGDLQVDGTISASNGTLIGGGGFNTNRVPKASGTNSLVDGRIYDLLTNNSVNFSDESTTIKRMMMYNESWGAGIQSNSGHLELLCGGGNVVAHLHDTGNVGIGTINPTAKLEIVGNPLAVVNEKTSLIIGNNYAGELWNDTILAELVFKTHYNTAEATKMYAWGTTTSSYKPDLRFKTDDIDRMAILGTGNIGIGTTAPPEKLTVKGGSFQQIGSTDNWSGIFLGTTAANSPKVGWRVSDNTERFRIHYLDVNGTEERLGIIRTIGGDYEVMSILADGRVGIGTTAPTAKLHVTNGFLRVSGSDVNQIFFEGDRIGVATTLRIYDNNTTPFYDSYGSMFFRANQTGGSGGYIGFLNSNVLIGATDDTGHKLKVNGSGRFLGDISSTSSIHADGFINSSTNYFVSGDNKGYFIGTVGGYEHGMYHEGTNLYFRTTGGNRVAITDVGKVVIGSTVASDKLTIVGSDTTSFQGAGIYNTTPYGTADKAESIFNLGKIEGAGFQAMGSIGAFPVSNFDSSNGNFVIYTRQASVLTPQVTVTQNGNIFATTFNGTLNGTAVSTTRFMSTSHAGAFWLENNWDGTYWNITSNHPSPTRVGFSDSTYKLRDARLINGVSFDGTSNISLTNIIPYSNNTAAETGRNSYSSGVYTYNAHNISLGGITPSNYWSVLDWGNGAGGSAQLATNWIGGGNKIFFRSLRDSVDDWWDWKEILHSNNVGQYSPSLTGGGASGTWGINISGNAANSTNTSTISGKNIDQLVWGNSYSGQSGAPTTWSSTDYTQWHSGFWDINGASWTPDADWYWGLTTSHRANTSGYNYSGQQIYNLAGTESYFRSIAGGTPNPWRRILHDNNFSSYALPITGGTITGRLNIVPSGDGYFDEGIRIGNYGGWSNIQLGTDGTLNGLNADGNQWAIAKIPSGQLIICPNAAQTDIGLALNKNGNINWYNQNMLHSGNFNSYAPTLTGGGASGNWGIDISGVAHRATLLQGYNLGSWIYFDWTGTKLVAKVDATEFATIPMDIAGNATTATNIAWSGITSKPTTLAGYGISETNLLHTTGDETKDGSLFVTQLDPNYDELIAIKGITTTNGVGVYGESGEGTGVHGTSVDGNGVQGYSTYSNGIYGFSDYAVGVNGYSNSGTAVHGYSNSGMGVYGSSNTGMGMYGFSNSGVGMQINVGGSSTQPIAKFQKGNVDKVVIQNDGTVTATQFNGNVIGNLTGSASSLDGFSSNRMIIKRRTSINSSDSTSLNSSITQPEMGFTYGGSGEPAGPFIAFGGLNSDINYSCQLVGAYVGGNDFKIRTKNDDSAYWNPWRTIVTDGNIGVQSVNYATTAGSATNATVATRVDHSIAGGSEHNLVYANMADNDQFRIRVGGGSNAGWVELATADDGNEPIYVRQYNGVFSSIARTATLLDSSGNTILPGTLNVYGDVVAYYSSDKRLKDNIKPIDNAMSKISKIGGYEFDWNSNQDTYKGHDVGVIAQEIEEVLPEVVTTRENGYKAVKYEKMIALLIQGMKEQQEQIEELKRMINNKN